MNFILNFEDIHCIAHTLKFQIMHDQKNNPDNITDDEKTKRLEQALKQDRLEGWQTKTVHSVLC